MSLVAMAASVAAAGPLSSAGNAINNGGGPDGGIWRGEEIITDGTFGGVVDFAVFAPGGFQTFLDVEFPGQGFTDASAGAEFVYAFQVAATGPAFSLQRLNAGFDLGANVGTLGSPQVVAGSGDSAPDTLLGGQITFNDTSAVWDWGFADSLAVGETSDILYYTSLFGPKPDGVTIGQQFLINQLDSEPFNLASPGIPEPSALGICLLAACAAMASRQRIS